MLKRALCRAEFTWELSCKGPLLIRDERYTQRKPKSYKAEDGYPQSLFISRSSLTRIDEIIASCARMLPEAEFYVPGTSLRGPFRAQAERILRSLCLDNARPPRTACDPFSAQDEKSQYYCCSKRLEKKDESNPPLYARACPACRIFGCAGLSSRIAFSDADIMPGYASAYRDMIGIDRFTGGVSKGANMKLHVLERASFGAALTLTNFELWQLGLLAHVFRDFKEGLVAIGFGKSKGFGQVTGEVTQIELSYCREPSGIEHLGSLMSEAECQKYGITRFAAPIFDKYGGSAANSGASRWRRSRVVRGPDNIEEFLSLTVTAFDSFISSLN